MTDESGPNPHPPDAVKHVRAGFDTGRLRSITSRKDQLRRLRSMLIEREDVFLAALAADLAKPAIEGYVTDLAFTRAQVDDALAHLDEWARPQRVSLPLVQQPGRAEIRSEPLGIVLVIGPWNYPIQLVVAPLIGAIAAGNTAVLKPSELATHCSAALAAAVREYLDPDCVAVVEGGVPETQALLAERWDHIFYTGNGTVGRVVMEAAARHLTPVTLELGGKSPVIVDRHANIDVAARRIAWGKFLNAGQTCVAPDYVLADRAVEQPLLAALARAVRAFYGNDPRANGDYARIVNQRHFDRLERLAETGGTPVVGGATDARDRFIPPTVLTDVDPAAPIMREEIFGPLLPVLGVEDVDAAIAFVNDRDKPLALYVFSEDRAVTERVLSSTSSGGAAVNATVLQLVVPGLPFGGVGPSGMGAYHGRAGFDTFSHRRSVLTKPTRFDPPLAYPPFSRWKQKLLRRFL
ncbi:MAG TPA: aldehyde dehydrogenase family protein [Acidimicrobiia bacterium]|nr:aldehyde dehydrogenase family protein [Acidimicrobiia bacterium]